MKNRMDTKFAELRRKNKKAFIAFITAGDPDLAATEQLVPALEEAGADIIELGVPFSDSLADGPTIQASYLRALKNQTTLAKILQTVKRIRRHSQVPIALMSSYNPIFNFGEKQFVQAAKDAGVDGVIVPDLPVEEAKTLIALGQREGLATVFFVSPTTTKDRLPRIIKAASGFIYFISLTGVTGVRKAVPSELMAYVKTIKRMTDKPICIGFGINAREQVKAVQKFSDGVIVGSAIVKQVEISPRNNLVKNVQQFVRRMVS